LFFFFFTSLSCLVALFRITGLKGDDYEIGIGGAEKTHIGKKKNESMRQYNKKFKKH
jgi:hypothetical protein